MPFSLQGACQNVTSDASGGYSDTYRPELLYLTIKPQEQLTLDA